MADPLIVIKNWQNGIYSDAFIIDVKILQEKIFPALRTGELELIDNTEQLIDEI